MKQGENQRINEMLMGYWWDIMRFDGCFTWDIVESKLHTIVIIQGVERSMCIYIYIMGYLMISVYIYISNQGDNQAVYLISIAWYILSHPKGDQIYR